MIRIVLNKLKSLMIIVLALISSMNAMSDETINHILIKSGEWQDQTNSDGTGLFWDIFREVYEPVGIKVVYDIVPYARSVYAVQSQSADAMVSAYPDEFEGGIFCDIPYLYDYVVVLYKKGKVRKWRGTSSLFGTTGWIRGYGYDQYLEEEIDFYEVNKHETGLKLLAADRLDFFITAENEIDDAFAHAEKHNYFNRDEYEMINPIMSLGLHLVFSDNERGRQLVKIYNDRIKQLIISGKLKPYYKKWSTKYPIQQWKKIIPEIQ